MKRAEAVHLLDGCATRLAAIPGPGLHRKLGALCVEWSLALAGDAEARRAPTPSRVRRAAAVAGFLTIRHERRAAARWLLAEAPVRGTLATRTPVSPRTQVTPPAVHPAAAVDGAMVLMRGDRPSATPPHRRRRGGTSP